VTVLEIGALSVDLYARKQHGKVENAVERPSARVDNGPKEQCARQWRHLWHLTRVSSRHSAGKTFEVGI
jgi:hypothetical protein